MANWWDNILNYIIPQQTQPPSTSTPPPDAANQGIVQGWYQQYRQSQVAPAQTSVMQTTPSPTVQSPTEEKISPIKRETLASGISSFLGRTAETTSTTIRTELGKIFEPIISSQQVQSVIKTVQTTAAPAQIPQQESTMSQLSKDIYGGASRVSAVIQTGMGISDIGARRIEKAFPGVTADIYHGTYELGKGIFLGAPKATVETVGMIPGGVETIARRPEMISSFVAAGVISQAEGIREGITKRPLQTVGELIGMAAIGDVGKAIRVGEVKIPTATGEVPIYKGLYLDVGKSVQPIIGYTPTVKAIPQEVAVGFRPELGIARSVEVLKTTRPIVGMPGIEQVPIVTDITPGYIPRTKLETAIITRPEVLGKFGMEPTAAQKISVGKELIELTREQKTAFQYTEPVKLSVLGKEITLPIERPALIKETKYLPSEGVQTTLEYLKSKTFKLSDVPTVKELESLQRLGTARTEGTPYSLEDIKTVSKPILERIGIDISRVSELKEVRFERPGELPEGVIGRAEKNIETGQSEIILKQGVELPETLETYAHEVSHIVLKKGFAESEFIAEPTAIKGSAEFITEFSKYYATADPGVKAGFGLRELFNKELAPYEVGKLTSKLPYKSAVKEEYKTQYPTEISPLIEKVMGSFPTQSQMMPNLRRTAKDIDVHTYATKEEATSLAKGLQQKLLDIGIESKVSGTTVETADVLGKFHHAVQFLPKEEPTTSYTGTEGSGLRYGIKLEQAPTKIEGFKVTQLGEQTMRKISSSLEFREGKVQPPAHRFEKDVIDAYTTALTLVESKSLKPGIPIIKEAQVARGRTLLEQWKELYPEIDWKNIGKEAIKMEIPVEGIGRATKKPSPFIETAEYAKRFSDPAYDLQYAVRSIESKEYVPKEIETYKKEVSPKEYIREAPYTPEQTYPAEYKVPSYDIEKYTPEPSSKYTSEKKIPYKPDVFPYKPTSTQLYPKYPAEITKYPSTYVPEVPPTTYVRELPSYPTTYPSTRITEQLPKLPVLPSKPEFIGKKKRKFRRPSKAYQVRNPFTDLENVLGTITESIKKETSTTKRRNLR